MGCVDTGIVIVGEDAVGHYDLGIFVASIVPGGPADKDGRIRPGGGFYFILMKLINFVCECFLSHLEIKIISIFLLKKAIDWFCLSAFNYFARVGVTFQMLDTSF